MLMQRILMAEHHYHGQLGMAVVRLLIEQNNLDVDTKGSDDRTPLS